MDSPRTVLIPFPDQDSVAGVESFTNDFPKLVEEIAFASVLELNHRAFKDIEGGYAEVFDALRGREIDASAIEEYRNALQYALFILEEKVEPLADAH